MGNEVAKANERYVGEERGKVRHDDAYAEVIKAIYYEGSYVWAAKAEKFVTGGDQG